MEHSAPTYLAIDLKSFYASVECVERGLDPLSARLVVADPSRTDKTICLAVSPALKAYGISGRARLFEVNRRLEQVYRQTGEKVDFIIAPPRMALYMQYSHRICDIYRHYVSDEDMHIYSVDEVFIDVTHYLDTCYRMTAHELAVTMIRHVLHDTGITATCGIGTNLYLAKVAMDVVAKHVPADEDGVRIASLDEMSYRHQLWDHTPLTDFWRLGRGTAAKLSRYGVTTLGQLARMSLEYGDFLYGLFGTNAELLIDHAWGYEPCTIADIKAYRAKSHSLSNGQVLSSPYPFARALTVIKEMADLLSLELTAKHLVAYEIVLDIHYDRTCLTDPTIHYTGLTDTDHYGRTVPKPAHGSAPLAVPSASTHDIIRATESVFTRVVHPELLIRRLNITAAHVVPADSLTPFQPQPQQLDLFADAAPAQRPDRHERDLRLQQTLVNIKHKFGKNAILRGLNYDEGATAILRNQQIGGHQA